MDKVRYTEKAPEIDFRRPSHTDFMDTLELAKAKFSGLRTQKLTGDVEIWIKGEIIDTINAVRAHSPEHLQQLVDAKLNEFLGLKSDGEGGVVDASARD